MKYENEGIQKRLDIITTLIEKTIEKIDNSILFSTNHTLNTTTHYDNDIPCINNNDELKNIEDNLTNNRQYRAELVILKFNLNQAIFVLFMFSDCIINASYGKRYF